MAIMQQEVTTANCEAVSERRTDLGRLRSRFSPVGC